MNLINSGIPGQCKILFLEDNADDIKLMRRVLEREDFKYVAQAVSNKKDFLEALVNFVPDVVIADYQLPMFNGMHAFRLFKDQKIPVPFILITGSLPEEVALECMNEGVDDFLLKNSFKRLPNIIKRAIALKQKETKVNVEIKPAEATDLALEEVKELLTSREFEVICLIGQGKSVKEIAAVLFISPATVATHRAHLLEKLQLKSNVDLARYVITHKLIN